jgi:hypothetical protein
MGRISYKPTISIYTNKLLFGSMTFSISASSGLVGGGSGGGGNGVMIIMPCM